MDSLSDYEPSTQMLHALKAKFSKESLGAADTSFNLYLKSREIDYDNVCTVLRMLLSIEDVASMKPYSEIIQHDVCVNRCEKNLYSIELNKMEEIKAKDVLTPNMDQVVLVPKGLPAPEGILALMPHKNEGLNCGSLLHRHVFEIFKVTDHQVSFKIKEEDPDNILGNQKNKYCILTDSSYKFHAIFRAPRIPVRLMYSALQILQQQPDIRRYLFPIPNLNQPNTAVANGLCLTLKNPSIATNAEQLQAVNQIVAGTNPQAPYIVFGPPGTGKTTTIVEAIMQLYLRGGGRILVTAGSNSACDTIAMRLYENLLSSLPRSAAHSDPLLDSKPLVKDFKRFYSFSYSRKKIPKLLNKNCCFLTNKDLSEGELCKYRIIVATLCSVGRIYTCSSKDRFQHIFIDEAAASTEAEALMAVVFRTHNPCHVILSGDNKQLGPVIKNERAASLGLDKSLMDRLLLNPLYKVDSSGKYDQTRQSRLRRNYRSHPEIVGIYNKLYYNGELIPLAPMSEVSQAANSKLLPNGKFPILFQEVFGRTERKAHSTSSFNRLEADVVCWMVLKLLCDGLGNGVKVKQEDIGIVTPYLAQCKILNHTLKQRQQEKVEVGSVESYQGREKTIIIASMVSSFKRPSFLSNPRRMNVMLSRAKSLMLLIGNPTTLNENDDFKFIISQCQSNGNYVSQEVTEIDRRKNFDSKLAEYRKIFKAEQEEMKKKEKEKEKKEIKPKTVDTVQKLSRFFEQLDFDSD